LKTPPLPSLFPGYQLYCWIFDFGIVNAISSTTAACNWFSRLGAVQPSR
jgi:hypothetical protein